MSAWWAVFGAFWGFIIAWSVRGLIAERNEYRIQREHDEWFDHTFRGKR